MPSLNKVMIIGNVGGEPEIRFSPDGRPATSFRVATNRVYATPEGERKQETEWFTVVAWGKLAEQCNQLLTKGRLIYAEGRLHTRTWDDQSGQRRYRTEIVANRVSLLDRQAPSASEDRGGQVGSDEVEQDGSHLSSHSVEDLRKRKEDNRQSGADHTERGSEAHDVPEAFCQAFKSEDKSR